MKQKKTTDYDSKDQFIFSFDHNFYEMYNIDLIIDLEYVTCCVFLDLSKYFKGKDKNIFMSCCYYLTYFKLKILCFSV